MGYWLMLLSSLRLFFIAALTIGNCVSIWKVVSYTKKTANVQINRLAVVCILIVNLVYLSLVLIPFSISPVNFSLKFNITNYDGPSLSDYIGTTSTQDGSMENPEIHPGKVEELFKASMTMTELKQFSTILGENALANGKYEATEPKKNSSDEDALNRVVRSATVESDINKLMVFPINESLNEGSMDSDQSQEVIEMNIFQSFVDLDCGFQDAVTSSCCYALAFVAIIKLILTKKQLTLPNTYFGQAGYAAILIGVPFLTTLSIRYAEQIGDKFAPHTSFPSASGYTVYNIICDIHISDSFVFLSFLEWAGLMMVLMLTVTLFLGVASKTENPQGYGRELYAKVQYKTLEKEVFVSGKRIRDIILGLGALWVWPLKPSAILIIYVINGQHWTTCISWTSHLLIAVSFVFIPLSTFLTSFTFLDDEDFWNCNASDEGSESGFPKEVTTKTGVSFLHSNLMRNSDVLSRSHFLRPNFDKQLPRGKYLRQFNSDNKNNTTDGDNNNSSIESITVLESSKCGEGIRNSLEMRTAQVEQPDYVKLVYTLPSNQANDGDKQLILENEEIGIPNTSDV